MMIDSEAADPEDDYTKTKHLLNVSTDGMSHGHIQKIQQEGGKNTYVLILSKDYLNSENSKGQSLLKCMSAGYKNVKKTVPEVLVDSEFDSPCETSVSRKKLHHPPEDVKLNLSNINDDEYDSNRSANSVFLQDTDQDSAIDVDQDTSSISRNYFCEKSKMNAYIIPSPIRPTGCEKPKLEQHTFKTTSPLKINSESPSKLAFQHERPACQTSSRKIVLVTPTHDQDGGQSLKKSVAYSNEAVPVMGRTKSSFQTPLSLLPKNSSKAIPTFSNISPINQQANTKFNSAFIPISVAEAPCYSAVSSGPFTSTPVTGEPHRRLQQLKQESSSHRPVYVIPSPFSRQTSNGLSSQTIDRNNSSSAERTTYSLNNSSGFISGSSSIETPDASRSFDGEFRGSSERRSSPMDCKEISVEVHIEDFRTKDDGSGGVVIKVNDGEDMDDPGLGYASMDPSLTSSQESESGDAVEKAGLNRSLTNIQWLKGMQLQDEKSSSQVYSNQQQNVQWTTLSPDEIKAISNECGRDKRPPFSYMSMIQMALYSRTDRKMMLKEICRWIEDTFPYYRFTAKPGWRNSIRHNLSLYNIFERESKKRHGSYWTLKSDVEPRTKSYHREKSSSSSNTSLASSLPTLPSQIPIIPIYSTMGQLSAVTPQTFSQSMQFSQNTASKKKGPPPILPRPGPYGTTAPYSATQAYALIPVPIDTSISTSSTNSGHQRVILNLPGSANTSACPSPIISEVSAAVASIQMSSASPIPQEHFCDSVNFQQELNYNKPINIAKQAWISCQSTDTTSSIDSDRAMDAASSIEIASSNEFASNTSRTKSKRPRVKPGLPKPTMYKNKTDEKKLRTSSTKRRKLQQKEKALLHESSDEDEDGSKFISNIEKEIFSRQYTGGSIDHDEIEELMATSTPAKTVSLPSTDLPSPICGLTPYKSSGLFDSSFLDNLTDRKMLGLSPELGDSKKSLNNSPRIDICLSDFNVLDGSPTHTGNLSNHNLSRILSECGLDNAMMDNVESFPNLSWSAVQQMVDSMDTD